MPHNGIRSPVTLTLRCSECLEAVTFAASAASKLSHLLLEQAAPDKFTLFITNVVDSALQP